MKLTVLGRYGPFPAPGGACSSYLLEAPGVRLLFDCGNGAFSRLRQIIPPESIDAVFLTHLHSDHMSDMLIWRYYLQQMHARGQDVALPLTVIAPSAPEAEFRMLTGAGTFNVINYAPGMRLRFNTLTVTLHRMQHPVPTYGIEVAEDRFPDAPTRPGIARDIGRFFYTSDTGAHDKLRFMCEGVDLLLCDAGLPETERNFTLAAHLTPRDAGALARASGAKRLLCTHIWGGFSDYEPLLSQVQAVFPSAELAEEMQSYEI